jgi:ankyrin repeat protein
MLTGISFGQTLPNEYVQTLKSDTIETFKTLVTNEHINTCFEAANSDYTLLALTIKLNAADCFQYLLERKADLEKSCTGKTPLMYAVKYGNLDMTKALIEAGAKLDFVNASGRTALDYAIKYEQKEIYDYLKTL